MNHHYELDTWMAADHWMILGNSRVYVKKAIQYVPIIGWAWCLFVILNNSDIGKDSV